MAVDVVVSLPEFTPPAEVAAAQVLDLSVQVTNQGASKAKGGGTLAIYASSDDQLDENDRLLQNVKVKGKLDGGVSLGVPVELALPADLTPGSTRLIVVFDESNKVPESDETNNTVVSSEFLVTPPDFDLSGSLESLKLPASVLSGGKDSKGSVRVVFGNSGASPLPSSQLIDAQLVLRPTEAMDDSNDIVIGALQDKKVGGLLGDLTKAYNMKVVIPGSLADGVYDVVLVLDSGDQLVESDELNNEVPGGVQVTVAGPVVTLVVADSALPFGPFLTLDGEGDGEIDLSNVGTDIADGTLDLRVLLRRDGEADLVIAQADDLTMKIKPGMTKTFKFDVVLPDGLVNDTVYQVVLELTPSGQRDRTGAF